MAKENQQRVVLHTSASRADLISIYFYNETSYGEAHAEAYIEFLIREMERIAAGEVMGKHVEDYPGVRTYIAKIRSSRSSHGHRILFREVEGGIEVIRVLHTAMNFPAHLPNKSE